MRNTTIVQESDVLWRGHPWVAPAFLGYTAAALAGAIILTWLEVSFGIAFLSGFSLPLLLLTYLLIFLLWVVSALNLAALRASSAYTLRGSSLEIAHGILGKKIFTLSAAGFSDLEVIQGLSGRVLNMGDIIMETDSRRDLRMRRVRDPIKVSAMIRQVMTTPMVRISPELMRVQEKATQQT
jgi:hypothetical protein